MTLAPLDPATALLVWVCVCIVSLVAAALMTLTRWP